MNESGLYALIFGSRKEKAQRFKRWVTSEVLPSIRKTGAYSNPNTVPQAVPASVEALEKQICLLRYVRRNRKMINLVMIALHVFALLFFVPALLVTIPVHLALAKLM